MKKDKGITIPNIEIVEGGKTVVGPEVMRQIAEGMGGVIQLATLGQLVKVRKSLEREQFKGRLDSRTLDATDRHKHLDLMEEWPHTPWATATFVNDGPHSVKIALNWKDNEHELEKDDDMPVDFTKADERIHTIFYWCAPGEIASVRALGKY